MRTGGFDMRGSVEAVAAVARDVATSSPSKNTASAALDMMRYQQRISPDCFPLANGSGSSSGSIRKLPAPAPRSSADVHDAHPAVAPADSSRGPAPSYLVTASLEQHKPRARVPHHPAPASSSAAFVIRSPARDHHQPSDFADHAAPNPSAAPDGGSSVRLQWGHNKRSRGRRDSPATPAPAPAPAAAETPAQARRRASIKIQRRAAAASASASAQAPAEKLMPPPSSTRGGPSSRASSYLPPRAAAVAAADALYGRTAVALQHHRSAEEPQPQPQPSPAARQQQRPHRQATEKEKGKGPAVPEPPPKQKQKPKQPAELQKLAAAAPRPEVPRIFTTLSRKEKEEDFLAMKGTKLPQRPKKRPKAVEKAVSMICPGQWLSEVSRSRYMVREKKSKKQKRGGGLKAMDSDTD